MLRLDELETLSRFAAGDLSAGEAAQFRAELQRRPELAGALDQLASLDRASRQLPPTLAADELETLIARVPRPGTRFRARSAIAVGLVGAALAAGLALFLVKFQSEPRPRLVALSGSVTVDGRVLSSPSEAVALRAGATVHCGAGSASIIESRQTNVLLARESELAVYGDSPAAYALQSGTLVATGPKVQLSAEGARVELAGRAVLSLEPEDTLVRVTKRMETRPRPTVDFKWLRLPVAATVAAAGAVTLFVLEGRAKVTTDSAAPLEVTAGQKWSSRDARPSPIASSTAMTAAQTVDSNPSANVVVSAAPPRDAKFETLSRDQLVAELKRLRSENRTLQEQTKDLQTKLDNTDPKRETQRENFYRQSPDELRALAERGEMRLHPPASSNNGPTPYGPTVANDVGLQPSEEAEIRNIYARSNRRLHDGLAGVYASIGGDANIASTLETNELLGEISNKTPPADRGSAVLTAARERAGLEQPANPNDASGLLRAFRLYYLEEDRVLAELDALLGPDRAEQFVNHQATSHQTISNRVSPDARRR
jgi:hypothetical protein